MTPTGFRRKRARQGPLKELIDRALWHRPLQGHYPGTVLVLDPDDIAAGDWQSDPRHENLIASTGRPVGVLLLPDGGSLPGDWLPKVAEGLQEEPILRATWLDWRLGVWVGQPIPTPLALAAAGDTGLAEGTGQALGRSLAALGFNALVGPLVDLQGRSIWGGGSEPGLAGPVLRAFVQGLNSAGITALPYFFAPSRVEMTLSELASGPLDLLRQVVAVPETGLVVPGSIFSDLDEKPAHASEAFGCGLGRGFLRVSGPLAAFHYYRKNMYRNLDMAGIDLKADVEEYPSAGIRLIFVVRPERPAAKSLLPVEGRLPEEHPRGKDLWNATLSPRPGSELERSTPAALAGDLAERSITLLRDNDTLPLSADARPVWLLLGSPLVFDPLLPSGPVFTAKAPPSERIRQQLVRLLAAGHTLLVLAGDSLNQPWQTETLRRLAAVEGRGALVVLAEEPAAAAAFPEADVICTWYGLRWGGIKAVWRALTGEIPWRGRLPVDIGRIVASSGRRDLTWYTTEDPHPGVRHLEQQEVETLLGWMSSLDEGVVHAVRRSLPQVARAVTLMAETLRQGGNVYYLGAGSAGRIGVFDAAEIPPTFGYDPRRVQGVMAGGTATRERAQEKAEDDTEAAASQLAEYGLGPKDLVVAITAHGETPYALGAVRAAHQVGARVVALVNNYGTPVARAADVAIEVLTGSEFLVGSTRLKAGTAEKLVLNMLSTVTMIQLGRVQDNLMIDFQAKNEKLRRRAENVVMWLAGKARRPARDYLEKAGWEVKTAATMALLGLEEEQARRLLGEENGSLKSVLEKFRSDQNRLQ